MKPLYLVIAIALVALVESGLGVYQARAVVPDTDWVAAAARVREQMQPHDLVVFAPAWIDPVGREHLGDRMPISMVARSDDDAYARIWELSIHGAHSDDTNGLTPSLEEHIGKITIRRFDKPSHAVLRDLTADFADAHVSMRRKSTNAIEQPCGAQGNARVCSGTTIEPRVMEIDYQPRRGILAPIIPGEIVSVTYDEVEGGGNLVGYAGLHDYYARKSASGVVFLRVHVDIDKTVTLPLHNEDGWKRFELELPPGKHRLVFELEADQAASRLPGFHAEVRAP